MEKNLKSWEIVYVVLSNLPLWVVFGTSMIVNLLEKMSVSFQNANLTQKIDHI